jgi:hypothetical protein
MATIGNLDLVPVDRRVGGDGASYLMAPFTHVSTDRPSRFTDGSYGVLYVGGPVRDRAVRDDPPPCPLHGADPKEAPGWTSQFREIVMSVDADLHDLRSCSGGSWPRRWTLTATRHLKLSLRTSGARDPTALSTRAFGIPVANASRYSTLTARLIPSQGRHLDYHWDGERVDLVRDAGSGAVFRIVDLPDRSRLTAEARCKRPSDLRPSH